ncbi:MAG: hypothetical protein ACYC5Q_16455 [Thermoleophilia bacterium]
MGRLFALHGPVAADVAEAEAAIAGLDVEAAALIDTEAFARLLLRVGQFRGNLQPTPFTSP